MGSVVANEPVNWYILNNTDVEINSDGVVTLSHNADYYTKNSYTYTIEARDYANHSDFISFTTNVNPDYTPENKSQLQIAINKWYELAKTSVVDANDYNGVEYYGNPNTWKTLKVTDMSELFHGKERYNNPDISTWNTENVTDMFAMFENSTFNKDISNWNVSKVNNMEGMFKNSLFNNDIGNWTPITVITMESMFENSQFNKDIGNWRWNIYNVRSFKAMFKNSLFDNGGSNSIDLWEF